MWTQVKKLSSSFSHRMDKKAEIAMEAIQATEMEQASDQRVPEDILPQSTNLEEDDESSIEALTWSDFDEEELEIAKELAQKEFPPVAVAPQMSNNVLMSSSQEQEGNNLKESDEDSPCSVISFPSISTSASQIMNDSDITMQENSNPDDKIINAADEALSTSILSVTSYSDDKSSNAAVLDDGPIWGKGAKSYKFHENQAINQKLTFGVLISIVLAIGIGVGNLVAYNEYESEFNKPIDHQHCPVPIHSSAIHMDAPSPRNTPYDKNTVSDYLSPNTRDEYLKASDRVVPDNAQVVDPFVSHTETLALVVKSIHELSKKIDLFQNTTRHLSGIIVMNDHFKTLRGSNAEKTNEFSRRNNMGNEEFSKFLPTFNDDLSSWEKSGGHHFKSDDPMCPPNPNQNAQDEKLKVECPKVPPTPEEDSVKEAEKITSIPILPDDVQMDMDKGTKSYPDGSLKHEEDKIDSQNVGKQENQNQKKKRSKNKEKIVVNQKDQKMKEDWKKMGRDELGNVDKDRQKSEDWELKQIKKKFRRDGEEKEYKKDKKKYTKEQGGKKEKKVKRDKLVGDEFEQKTNVESNGGKEINSGKTKNVKANKHVESESQDFRVKSKRQNKKVLSDDQKKVKKHKKDSERQLKDNNFHHQNEGLPEHNSIHKVKRSDTKENVEKKVQGYRDDDGSRMNNDRRSDSEGTKYPKHKKNKKDLGNQKDWTLERAKLRETQRVQQHWNNDFNQENQFKGKRKRSQNWQIERDRVREKIRKVDNS